MSSAGPWSVKGIDPRAREVAKDLARRSGMTLGEWLNQVIIEGGDADSTPPAPEAQRRFAALGRRADVFARPWEPEGTGELSRLTRALESFSDRLEAAEHRSTLAISGIDRSVLSVLSRLDGLERDQGAAGPRYEGALDEVRVTQAKLAERLRRMELDDSQQMDAMKALEQALSRVAAQMHEAEARTRGELADLAGRLDRGEAAASPVLVDSVVARVAERLEAAESRTSAAVRALETSFAALDQRLTAAESGGDGVAAAERRFERLAAELSERVEASRAELTEQLHAAADSKIERLETALNDLGDRVEAAERQSAQAIDRMGHEVIRIAQGLGQRVEGVEARNARAVEQMGGEMARLAGVMEARMGAADAAQAEALERLGAEIGRIAERLSERIATSERRAATAIDEIGDQVAGVSDKLAQRYERAETELSQRIRQSEERTAQLLREARETLGRGGLRTGPAAAVEAPVEPFAADPVHDTAPPPVEDVPEAGSEPPPPAIEDFDDEAFSLEGFIRGPAAADIGPHDGVAARPSTPFPDDPFSDDPFEEAAEPDPGAADADIFEPGPLGAAEGGDAEPAPSDETESMPSANSRPTTRELIEAARAAARAAAAADKDVGRARGRQEEIHVPAFVTAAEPARGLGALLGKGKKKKKEAGPALRTLVLASGTAAALSMTMVGAFQIARQSASGEKPVPPAQGPAAAASRPGTAPPAAGNADILAAAVSPPSGADKPAAAPAETAAPAPAGPPLGVAELQPLLSDATRRIESGDATGLEPLRRAANLGYAPAQFYLAHLYETGAAGLKKDPAEARRWIERAAAGGEPKAMHDLGLSYFEGVGGPKSLVQAAAWFRKAAEAGYEDSQYNLARLYEQGYGLPPNLAEAYKWYLIAAASGDAEARASADRVRGQLTPEALQAAQRSAAAFRGTRAQR